jgi:hypothetical protein
LISGEFQDDIVDDGLRSRWKKITKTYTVENTGTIPLNTHIVVDVLDQIADGNPLLLPRLL